MNTKIGDYSIINELIVTDKTIVYKVQNDKQQKAIAKTLVDDQPGSSDIARYEREFMFMQKIDSPYVVKASSYVMVGCKPALILEDCSECGDLGHLIQSKQHLPLAKLLDFACGVASGLQAIHQAKLIHLDINPSNIVFGADGTIKIIDFGIAKELDGQDGIDPQNIAFEGSLPYMSPEQTGSMNRMLDYRSDLYSLGITFYQLFSGTLPFQCEDRISYIHAHIAREAVPLCTINPLLPQVIGDIVHKLISKNAEDRYQSAFGLLYDLEQCRQTLAEGKKPRRFPLGEKDKLDRIHLGHYLYSRENDQKVLKELLEQVARGQTRVALIEGSAGIGKSSLALTLQQVCVQRKYLFAAAQFEHGDQDQPLSGISRALDRTLVGILATGKHTIDEIKSMVLERLGQSTGFLCKLLPTAATIFGNLEVPELDPGERKQVILSALRDLCEILTRHAGALVLCCDNFQLCDQSSIDFLEHITLRSKVHGVLVVLAYRPNEVIATSAQAQFLNKFGGNAPVNRFELTGLTQNEVETLVSTALHMPQVQTTPLADLIFQKTQGNPLYIGEILKLLQRNGGIVFDYDSLTWRTNLKQAQMLKLSDNLADFIAEKFATLDDSAKKILAYGAVIGQEFVLGELAILLDSTTVQLFESLKVALKKGILLCPSDDYQTLARKTANMAYAGRFASLSYRFTHDKLYNCSYDYLTPTTRQTGHLTLARYYISHPQLNKSSSEIAANYIIALPLVTDADEKCRIVTNILDAARKAKERAAFVSAQQYLSIAKTLLDQIDVESNQTLAITTMLEHMECSFLAGLVEDANTSYQWLIEHVDDQTIKHRIYEFRAFQLTTLGQLDESVRYGLETIATFGIKVPIHPSMLSILREYVRFKRMMLGRKIAAISELPLMTDPNYLTVMKISSFTVPSAFVTGNRNLFAYLVLVRMRLSLQYGLAPSSPASIGGFSMLLSHKLGKLREGAAYGNLVTTIVAKHKSFMQVGRSLGPYTMFIAPWNHPFSEARELNRELHDECLRCGDLVYLGMAAATAIYYPQDIKIGELPALVKRSFDSLLLSNSPDSYDQFYSYKLFFDAMVDRSTHNLGMHHQIEPADFLASLVNRHCVSGLFVYAAINIRIAYLYGDYVGAKKHLDEAVKSLDSVVAHATLIDYHFFGFLTLAKFYAKASKGEKKALRRRMQISAQFFAGLAGHMPENFRFFDAVIRAESAALFGGTRDQVQRLFDEAIAMPLGFSEFWSGFGNHEAALWHKTAEREKLARFYAGHAFYHYRIFGASGLCNYMAATFRVHDFEKPNTIHGTLSSLARTRTAQVRGGTLKSTAQRSTAIDSNSLIRNYEDIFIAMQSLGDEADFNGFLTKFAKLLLEYSGAEKLMLVLKAPEGGRPFLALEGTISTLQKAKISDIPIDNENMPMHLVDYVERSKQSLILDAACQDGDFTHDSYIQRHGVLSALCCPLTRAAQFIGLIYLENSRSKGAFTEKNLNLVKLLAQQTSATIQSALLQPHLERKVTTESQKVVYLIEEIKSAVHDFNEIKSIKTFLNELVNRTDAIGFDQLIKNATAAIAQRAMAQQKTPPHVITAGDMVGVPSRYVAAIEEVFTHLTNHLLDNGIEKPANRLSQSKSPEGLIKITATVTNDLFCVRCSDDGVGLNLTRIKADAEEQGLLTKGGSAEDEAIAGCIFAPALAGGPEGTPYFDRKLAMNAVAKSIEELGGRIFIDFIAPRQGDHRCFQFVIEWPRQIVINDGKNVDQNPPLAA